MTVTVIVPVYNASEYLCECVDSILAQTHSDLDVILVDDGSTDASGAICESYASADTRVRVIHKPNGGLSSARNAGLDKACGGYVTFVDADDALHPSAIQVMFELIGEHDVSIAGFYRGIDCRWSDSSKYVIKEYTSREAIEDTLYQHGITNSACAKLYRIGLFDNLRFKDGLWYEDLDLFYKVYERAVNGMISTTQYLYFYRTNPHSFINTFDSRRLYVLKVTDEIESHYANDPVLHKAAVDRRFSAYFNMFILTSMHRLSEESDRCWRTICDYRLKEIANPKVRMKNRVGALISYLGRNAVMITAKIIFRYS